MYKTIFIVGLVLALLFLVISIVLFVRNNVAKLIGDVTGWNARKAIKQIRERGTQDQSKQDAMHANSSELLIRGEHVTTSIPTVDTTVEATTPLQNTQVGAAVSEVHPNEPEQDMTFTNVFEVEDEMMVFASDSSVTDEMNNTLSAEEETTLLMDDEEATTLLAGEETTLLVDDEEATTLLAGEETTLLMDDEEATTLLAGEETTLLMDGEEATTLLAGEETTLLMDGEEATTLLTETK